MRKLSDTQIEEYFNNHLPYRNQVLMAHKKLCAMGSYHGDQAILRACFEASLVTGRMYLNMLGISIGKNGLVDMKFRPDDISVKDLGGKLVAVSQISMPDRTLFGGFLKMANKNAHLTRPIGHSYENTHKAIDCIVSYLKKYLYIPTNHCCSL